MKFLFVILLVLLSSTTAFASGDIIIPFLLYKSFWISIICIPILEVFYFLLKLRKWDKKILCYVFMANALSIIMGPIFCLVFIYIMCLPLVGLGALFPAINDIVDQVSLLFIVSKNSDILFLDMIPSLIVYFFVVVFLEYKVLSENIKIINKNNLLKVLVIVNLFTFIFFFI